MNKYFVSIAGIVIAIGSFLFGSAYSSKTAQENFAANASVPKAIIAVILDSHLLGSVVVNGDYSIQAFEGQSREDALGIASKLPKSSAGVINLHSQCKDNTT